ncbi:hypothetical protein Q8791_28910 [Nocardiopsis sp. CT-R113]|uniref:Uncharacterized protein n=1 Tax=Nocardiopsis codii TaxID=3065942 RepID=A0ABU7KGC4_9ACTN|nr:hypothetical protein [Nocardiopsis sp. CT-R113]MEE2041252.1 hypothetical protein [Nocardiopsis sp. CT-R113]
MNAAQLAEYLLPAFMAVGMAAATWLGYLLGAESLLLVMRRARRLRAEVRRLRSERTELVAQLIEAETSLGRATGGTDAIMRAVRQGEQ